MGTKILLRRFKWIIFSSGALFMFFFAWTSEYVYDSRAARLINGQHPGPKHPPSKIYGGAGGYAMGGNLLEKMVYSESESSRSTKLGNSGYASITAVNGNHTIAANLKASNNTKIMAINNNDAALHHNDDEDVARVMQSRRKLVSDVCSSLPKSSKSLTNFHNKAFYAKEHEFIYCPVEKTASTFGRRFFYQLLHSNPVKSPFDISVNITLIASDHFPKVPRRTDVLRHSTKLLYVRDPYSRIFSAFIDKLMSPNPYYWNLWGNHKTILQTRKDFLHGKAIQKSCKGGHDVTFSEFASFATDFGHTGDTHLVPISRACSPCGVDYTVIGKMESFKRDSVHLLGFLNIQEKQIGFERMDQDASDDAIEDSSKDALSKLWLKDSLRCISKEDVAKRILRKLQIRGFVSWRFRLNLKSQEYDSLDFRQFVKLMKDSRLTYNNKTELKLQKKQSFKEAVRTLSERQFQDIARVYGDDCRMFGYPTKPDFMKINEDVISTNALDWKNDWDMTPVL